jgi:DNA-binding protein YbaB
MQQTKEIQHELESLQKELAETIVVGEAGAGHDKVMAKMKVLNHDLIEITISDKLQAALRDPDLPETVPMMLGLITAAVNNANRKAEKLSKEKMGKVANRMQLPFNLQSINSDGS